MLGLQWPTRKQQIAIAAMFQRYIHLKKLCRDMKLLSQQVRLIAKTRSTDVVVDFLKTNQVWILMLDDLDNPFEPIASIASADAFMNVVAQ
jgi:hypothetical protein